MLLRKPISNVNLFSGKDREFREKIIYFLAINGESTTWKISQFISKDEIRKGLSHESTIVKKHLSGVYRNIKERMVPEKYVKQISTKISKGKDVPTYGLTFRGSLAVQALDLKRDELRPVLERNSDVNPFYKLILSLETNGVKFDMCDKIILKGLINGVKNNLINMSNDNESIIGQSVIPALAVHFSSMEKTELRKFRAGLNRILDKKFPDGLSNILNYLIAIILSPLFWAMWNKDENSQLITLYYLIDTTLNPKNYEIPMTGFDESPKLKYDTRFDDIKVKN